ncbi:MAG: arginine N-succinyltransferase [Gammaproteobacteria bacterium]|nr:MAG: arginine N-succinyltransferase [Gammaproteobacteria bacterium]
MMIIRPVRPADLEGVLALAESAGVGVTTLPPNRELLARKIEVARQAFHREGEPRSAYYMFALEDTETGRVAGVSAVDAGVGLQDVWYNYRLSNTVHASAELGIHRQIPTLYLSNDMTGCSEVCTLFLHEDYRKGANGRLLSLSRFLFMADFREMFSEKVFAEMRGVSDENGLSPFWEGLGRKFFTVDFSYADYLTGIGNKAFIAELMPKHPIFVPFLPESAQSVIGKVHENTGPALHMLHTEGFNFNGMVDIFDGGPLVEAFVHNVRTVRESFKRYALVSSDSSTPAAWNSDELFMVSNRNFEDFRVALVPGKSIKIDTVTLPPEAAKQLNVTSGDTVRLVRLKPGRKGK